MEHSVNQVLLRGILRDFPQLSHINHGKEFYKFTLEVPRLSGAVDILPILSPWEVLRDLDPTGGDMLTVHGQIRSHNLNQEGRRHLMVFTFATCILSEAGEYLNQVQLEGSLCREPTYRRTPLGREICDIMLAVPRAFRRADYLPCILWGRTAQEVSACHIRSRLRICGRFQSREYTKVTDGVAVQKTTYEISGLSAQVLEEIL